jgi:hypothetical protein
MDARPFLAWTLAGLLLLAPTVSGAVDQLAGKERIGGRVGGVFTMDDLERAYGGGWGPTLFFTERISRPLYFDVRIGALYLGALKLTDLDDELLSTPGVTGSMRLLYISVGPLVGWSLGGAYSMYASAGGGIYSVSMEFTDLLTPFDLSDQYFGANGGLGLCRRLTGNWSLELYSVAHYFITDEAIDDIYWAFTEGDSSPLVLEAGLGVVVDLR